MCSQRNCHLPSAIVMKIIRLQSSGASFFVLLNSNVQRVSVVARQVSGNGGGVGQAVPCGNAC